ncbi:BatA and WFA domain-containing protein, partial [Victivallis vadensis]
MIDFGASLWLWLLPPVWGAALVLHLYFRRKRQVVPFSDVGFFLRDEHHPAMRRKLRDWLKLLVRLLILTLPVLAMAQPRLTGMKLAAGDEPRRVIVLDDSFSMERKLPAGESAFDAARRLALSLADSFDDGETALVFTSDVPGVLPTRDRDKLREAIRAAKLRPRAATLGTALAGAAEQAGVTEIFLISDFQQSMLGKWEERRGLRIYALALRGRDDNLAVEVSGGAVLPPRAGVEQQLRVKAVNYSGRPAESRLEFRYGGRKAGERLLNLSPGESRELEFSFTPAPGLTSGSVTVEDGNVTQDNRA